ncbi:ABC transporter ATP-binding protein [Patulibacter defluvii]|uniref:ABC transporter ATP-binding protein n=1 Tax=Patulibacter defluvii TaxID=3095358 RepID=UPI002A74764C|nr:ABC transporter ATP-binding protein [Patulibacter sp. DM4]
MSEPLLDVRGLRIGFGRGAAAREVVHGIDLRIGPGECLALVGESGSGKSVSARALVGLAGAGARLTAERLTVAGHDGRGLRDRGWRAIRGRDVGFVLQDALTALDPLRTVGAEVAEPLRIHRDLSRAATTVEVERRLAAAGIPDPERRRRQHPHELSGGLRQRALIATALAADPPLLIADEPTTALDVTVQARILELLASLKEAGRGLLLVSHDLAVVARIADRIAVMDGGRIVEQGTAARVIGAPEHPATRTLLDAIPRGRRAPAAAPAPAGREEPLLRATDLRKRYRDAAGHERDALAGVSATVRRGETLGVVGESGSGKTTLARTLLGLLEPDAGTVALHGQRWSGLRERDRRPRRPAVQHVPQDPLSALDPRHDVRAVLREALGGRRLRDRGQDRRLVALLEEVGLPAALLDHRPGQLSGGQRQRVAIARALAVGGGEGLELLVCDEPVSALDVRTQAQILRLLDRIQRDRRLAIVFVSHDLAVVREVCDRVLVMRDGRVVEEGPVATIFDRPAHPYTRELLAATPTLDRPAAPPEREEVLR